MFTIKEIIDLVIMVIAIGYILSGYIKKPRTETQLIYKRPSFFNFEDFKFAALVTAPAIVLHELAHKFTAMAFGLSAIFKIFLGGLGLGVLLRLIHSPFLIIAPGYVQISQTASVPQMTLIAFAGPLINLILFLGSWFILNRAKLTRNQAIALYLTKQINLLLFIFNMLPIKIGSMSLDGYKVFSGLFRIIF